MFDGLSGKLGDVFERLKRRGALKEGDVNAALREVRVALLEADVALDVVKSFIDKVRERAIGHRGQSPMSGRAGSWVALPFHRPS